MENEISINGVRYVRVDSILSHLAGEPITEATILQVDELTSALNAAKGKTGTDVRN